MFLNDSANMTTPNDTINQIIKKMAINRTRSRKYESAIFLSICLKQTHPQVKNKFDRFEKWRWERYHFKQKVSED
jgi:hypothetical protein